jgi:plastocyanin
VAAESHKTGFGDIINSSPWSLWLVDGPVADGVDTIKIGDNNVEYAYWPARTRVKAGTAVTFTNVGDTPHTATAFEKSNWDTGVLEKGQSKTITFSEPGSYYYICAPHPWMYGQIIVE